MSEDVIHAKEIVAGNQVIRGAGYQAEIKVKKVTCTIVAGEGTGNPVVATGFFEDGMCILHACYKIISMTNTFPETLTLTDTGGNIILSNATGGLTEGTVTNCDFAGGATGRYNVARNTDSIGATDLNADLDANCGDNPLIFEVIIVYMMLDYDA